MPREGTETVSGNPIGRALIVSEDSCIPERYLRGAGPGERAGLLPLSALPRHDCLYDLREPFRFLVDLAVISLIETDRMEKSDFIRTERYTPRPRPTGAGNVTGEATRRVNTTIGYQGKEYAWAHVLLLKSRELAHYLIGMKRKLDLGEPAYEIDRQDSDEMRRRILAIPYSGRQIGSDASALFLRREYEDEIGTLKD